MTNYSEKVATGHSTMKTDQMRPSMSPQEHETPGQTHKKRKPIEGGSRDR